MSHQTSIDPLLFLASHDPSHAKDCGVDLSHLDWPDEAERGGSEVPDIDWDEIEKLAAADTEKGSKGIPFGHPTDPQRIRPDFSAIVRVLNGRLYLLATGDQGRFLFSSEARESSLSY
jgi:hypothetical protein